LLDTKCRTLRATDQIRRVSILGKNNEGGILYLGFVFHLSSSRTTALTTRSGQNSCASAEATEETHRLLILHMQRPHAEIRLGALHILSILSNPHSLAEADIPSSTAVRGAFKFRELTIMQLQDCLSYLLPTKDSDQPLPPPKTVADKLQQRTLELLLLWDREMTSGVCKSPTSSQSFAWNPSPRVSGQLSALMRYLRTTLLGDTATPCLVSRRLRDVGARIAELERTHLTEEAQRQRSASTADAVIRRRLLGLRKSYLDSKLEIEENLTSLRAILDLLIRDPFDEFGGLGEEDANATVDPREHGILFSSSSGFGASYASETVPVILDVAVHQDTSQPTLLPKMHIILTEEIRMTQLCSSSPSLADALAEQSEAQNMLARLDKLTHLFADAIVFEEPPDANTSGDAEKTMSVNNNDKKMEKDGEFDDDDEDDSDFLEVPLLVDADLNKPLPPPSPDADEKLLAEQVVYVTEKLPWEQETAHSDRPRTFCSSNSRARQSRKLGLVRRRDKKVAAKVAVSERATDYCVLSESEMTPNCVKTIETQHRFWKPIEPEDFEAPDLDQMEAAISLNLHREPPLTPVAPAEPIHTTAEGTPISPSSPPIPSLRPGSTLACWTPLPSGKLCPRRDPTGRCRIHGSVVPRNPRTGSPVNEADKLRLQAELARQRNRG
uniref:DUF384 domain-containing protein n=1 Tax=Schistocephalus solidus TaxID=70667 RepID=A0A183SJM6_SCHSO